MGLDRKARSNSIFQDEGATGGAMKKVVLKIFAIFTGKQLCWSLFLIKLQTLWPATSLKRDFWWLKS